MRGVLADYELVSVDSLAAALARVGDGYAPLAGGTDVMVMLAAGKLPPGRFVDVWKVAELRGAEATADELVLGALTTYTELQANEIVRREFPMLAQAAAETGGWAIQNRGTLGGNIANASPAADSPPALLAYDASLELLSAAGRRTVPYAEFHTGYKRTILQRGELIARVRLPRRPGPRAHFYRKVGPRRAQAISKICFAACAERDPAGRPVACRIALGAVAPVPLRCPATERAVLAGDPRAAYAALEKEIAPIDDLRSSGHYRRRVAGNLLEQFLLLVKSA